MLEDIRNNSGSLIVWILFAVIIAAFVLFFGPQSSDDMFGCGKQNSNHALSVDKSNVKTSSWRFAMNGLPYVSQVGRTRSARIPASMNALIERQLLANAAKEKGIRISDALVDERIASGELLVMGHRLPWGKGQDSEKILPPYFDDNGAFDYEKLTAIAGQSFGGLSIDRLRDEQKTELLADTMRQFISKSALVSDEELRSQYVLANTKISADYVSFFVADARSALILEEADLKAFEEKHGELMEKAWQTEKPQWADPKERLSARIIKIDTTPAPDQAPAPENPSVEASPKPNPESQKKIATLQKRLKRGDDFSVIARELSDDVRTKSRGGSTGWRSADSLGYGKELSEAVRKLEIGKVSDLIETQNASFYVVVDKRSDKALTYEDFKSELREDEARDFYAPLVTKKFAEVALAQAQGKSLSEIYETSDLPKLPPGFDPAMFLKNQSQGALMTEGEDIPAQAGVPDTTENAKELAAASTTAEPAKSVGPLPKADMPTPELEVLQGASRSGNRIAGVGESQELARALFDELTPGKVSSKLYSVSEPEGFVIVELTDRTEADMEKFTKDASKMREEAALSKGVLVYVDWLERRCNDAVARNEIEVNDAYLQNEDGATLPFEPCANISPQLIFQQFVSRMRLELSR